MFSATSTKAIKGKEFIQRYTPSVAYRDTVAVPGTEVRFATSIHALGGPKSASVLSRAAQLLDSLG